MIYRNKKNLEDIISNLGVDLESITKASSSKNVFQLPTSIAPSLDINGLSTHSSKIEFNDPLEPAVEKSEPATEMYEPATPH